MAALSNRQRDFLLETFADFAREKIPLLVLRNYEKLPESCGRDLDLFCATSDAPRAVILMIRLARRHGLGLLHRYDLGNLTALYFSEPDTASVLHLDVFHGAFSWAGIKYLTDDEVLAGAVSRGPFSIPNPAHEALLLCLASILDGGFFKARYLGKIRYLLTDGETRKCFHDLLSGRFGPSQAEAVQDLISRDSAEFTENRPVPELARALRKSLVSRSLRQNPVRASLAVVRFLGAEVLRLIRPAGMVVVITGPDGAGKSSVIEGVTKRLEEWLPKPATFHWRPGLLPDVGVLLKVRKASRPGEVNRDPHGQKPHGTGASLFRVFFYFLDYWLGYFALVRRATAKNRVVIFDRYFLDMICDPRRFRLNVSPGLLKFLFRLAPPVDLTFALHAPGEVLFERKAEVTLQESRRQSDAYRSEVSALRTGRVIDANQPLQEVIAEVYRQMGNELARRAETRNSAKPLSQDLP